jgi:ribosomal protein S18 acetylase RimI-like enzyme
MVDVRITLEMDLPITGKATDSGDIHIRSGTEEDLPALTNLARVSHRNSRFYADRHFDRARCDELYATWIEKSCRDPRQRVLVAEKQGGFSGYVACHRADESTGQLGLMAVSQAAQGQAVGRTLLRAALDEMGKMGLARAVVVTQGSNIRAQRLYQAHGFRTRSVRVWYHAWLPEKDRFIREGSL